MSDDSAAKLLIIEDDMGWWNLYTEIFSDYELKFCSTAKDAEVALETFKPDLALVDLGLDKDDDTNRDGIKLIKQRFVIDPRQVPVLIVTGDKTKFDQEDSELRDFIEDVIEKGPTLKPNDIRLDAHRALRRSRARLHWQRLSRKSPSISGYRAFELFLEDLVEHMNADVAHLLVPANGTSKLEVIASTIDEAGRAVPVDDSITGIVYKTNEPLNVGDVTLISKFKSTKGINTRSELAVPIRTTTQQIIAVLNIESEKLDAFSEQDEVLLSMFAKVALRISGNEHRQIELNILRQLAGDFLASVLDLEKVWGQILETGAELISAQSAHHIEVSAVGEHRVTHTFGRETRFDPAIAEEVITGGHSIRIRQSVITSRGSHQVIAVPYDGIDDQIAGILVFESDPKTIFTVDDEKLIIFLANYASIATRMAEQAKIKAKYLATLRESGVKGIAAHSISGALGDIRMWLNEVAEIPKDRLEYEYPTLVRANDRVRQRLSKLLERLAIFLDTREYTQTMAVDVKKCLQRAIESLSERIDGVRITINADDLPNVAADNNLEAVLYILIQNSLDALERYGGQKEPSITIEAQTVAEQVVLTITDNGPGFPKDAISFLGEYKMSFKEDPQVVDGTGLLGAKQVLSSYSSTIKFDNLPEGGARVLITLQQYDPGSRR